MILGRRWQIALGSSVLPLGFLEGARIIVGASFAWVDLALRLAFVLAILSAACTFRAHSRDHDPWFVPMAGMATAATGLVASVTYIVTHATPLAWVALIVFFASILELDTVLASGRNRAIAWVTHLGLAILAGIAPVAVSQIEARFSDEEFFVALEAMALAVFWLILRFVWRRFWRLDSFPGHFQFAFRRRWLGVCLVVAVSLGLVATVRAYQASFFSPHVPSFEGVSPAAPFLCGQSTQETETFDGKDVFRRLLARVEANPNKGTPEYGMLALGNRDGRWATEFRRSLLSEANHSLYTGPSNSVKSTQFDAAVRLYYLSRLKTMFPDLFTSEDDRDVRAWFAAVNRRALTVEWVDWMYGIAFSKLPEGPYENQENGAGLLALLQATGYAAPELAALNQDYLARNQRGWDARFRNTDDAIIYQPEWIENAFFQSLLTGNERRDNAKLAFEWLLLQALPDGSALRYNFPNGASLAPIAYLGASLLGDGRYIWLSGKALADVESRGGYLFAQPGVDQAVDLQGRAPGVGSCLLYGDSGLPNQAGPLAPDKIVFRDGWNDDAAYMLLNLRFTGWHRYNGTNTITLLHRTDSLVGDGAAGQPFGWLPVGRSLFRDKRIPRENLSGLLIERSGMSAVLYAIDGIGGPWAQDPPYYAWVEQFKTSATMDTSTTVLGDWHGWQHFRSIYFYHGGPIVVIDRARGPVGQRAGLMWRTAKAAEVADRRIQLSGSEGGAEMLLVPMGSGVVQQDPGQMLFLGSGDGHLDLATVFLAGEWVGAEASFVENSTPPTLEIQKGAKHVVVPTTDEQR